MERLGLNIGSREKVAGEATTSRERLASEATSSREKIASEAAASRERIGTAANTSREKIAAAKPLTDTSAAEKRVFDSLVEIHTVRDENGIEATDWNAVADGLDEKGFGKLAKAARSRGKGIVDLDIRTEAEAQADAEVEEKASFFSTDATDFKEDGGSRVRFRARRVREIIAERSGKEAVGPYVGEAPPPEFPDAKRAEDGFWYVPDPDRPGKFKRVQR